MSHVVAVCRVHELHADPGSVGITAIDKRPVDGPVAVRRFGLYGDVQADRRDHGGPDQAVYAYAEEEAAWWAAELGQEVWPGRFGENLRTRGLDVDAAEIGAVWRIGDVLELEVTCPRTPCATFGRFLGQERWVRRFSGRGRTGAYLRVVRPGDVQAGDRVHQVSTPGHGVTVSRWYTGQDPADARTLLDAERDGALTLGERLRDYVEASLARA